MEKKDLKKLLASLGIASLIGAGGSMAIPGNAATASGWTATTEGAGSVEKAVTDSTSTIDEVQTTAEEAVEAAEKEAKKKAEEAVDTAVDEVKKKAGDSGWAGSK